VSRSLARLPYRVSEAADTLDRPISTIRRWIRIGRLPAKLVKGRYEVDAAAVDELVEAESLPFPSAWGRTATGEPMPNVVGAVRRVRGNRSSSHIRR
jgi:excisionase family DNA binding protein